MAPIELIEWWMKYLEKNFKKYDLKPRVPILKVEFVEMESWCLSWFSHYIFDIGQDDGEVLASFESFINRKIQKNREKNLEDGYGLMGAEEHWRLKKRTLLPCRCKYCKKHGLIRIVH